MIYYESQVSDFMRQALHKLAGDVVERRMHVVCPNKHLAMKDTEVVPELVYCPFCEESYEQVEVFTHFHGPDNLLEAIKQATNRK